jgi:hypothetical protein
MRRCTRLAVNQRFSQTCLNGNPYINDQDWGVTKKSWRKIVMKIESRYKRHLHLNVREYTILSICNKSSYRINLYLTKDCLEEPPFFR